MVTMAEMGTGREMAMMMMGMTSAGSLDRPFPHTDDANRIDEAESKCNKHLKIAMIAFLEAVEII